MKYIYIVNRFQFKDQGKRLIQGLEEVSKKLGREYGIHVNASPREACLSMERYQNTEYVITAVGGDGSVNMLLNSLMGTRNILSFIPAGTGNDFNRVCGETLENGIHSVDVIRINDRYFINTACFGIDADIANDDLFIHNRLIPRPLRYHTGVLRHFISFKEGRRMKLEWEENMGDRTKIYRTEKNFTTIVAANGRYYGGGYKVSPASRINDGSMEVYLVDKVDRLKMATMILSMKRAGHLNNPALQMIRTNKLRISSDRQIKANIDGEPLLAHSFGIELIQDGIRLDYNRDLIHFFNCRLT